MNLFRIKRKSNRKKIGLKKFILVILLLIMTTLAWFTYTKVLNNNISILVGAWDIKFYEILEDEDGNEIENEIDKLLQVHVKDLYPGMENDTIKVKIRNNGLTDAAISCLAVDGKCSILGVPYEIVADGKVPLTDYYIMPTENIRDEKDENMIIWNFIDKNQTLNDGSQRFPFSITVKYPNIIKRKSSGMLTITTTWLSDDNPNELDTQWGYETGLFFDKVLNNEITENTNPVNFELLVNAILPRASN